MSIDDLCACNFTVQHFMELLNLEISPDKHYFAIGEVAQLFNTTVTTIRFWENEFDVLKPKKNKKGDRFFTRKDLEYLRVIYYLLKEQGYTIEGAKKKVLINPDQQFEKVKIIDSLKEVRSFLVLLKNSLGNVDQEA